MCARVLCTCVELYDSSRARARGFLCMKQRTRRRTDASRYTAPLTLLFCLVYLTRCTISSQVFKCQRSLFKNIGFFLSLARALSFFLPLSLSLSFNFVLFLNCFTLMRGSYPSLLSFAQSIPLRSVFAHSISLPPSHAHAFSQFLSIFLSSLSRRLTSVIAPPRAASIPFARPRFSSKDRRTLSSTLLFSPFFSLFI